MKKTKFFLLLAMTFLLLTNYGATQKIYTRAQVDSIVAVEVRQQLDKVVAVEVQKQLSSKNVEIELLVEKSSQDRLSTYITEQNNQLTRQNTHFTILITVLMAIFGVGAPILINRQYEKRLDAIAKKNEEKISADIETKTSVLNARTSTLNKNIKKHDKTIKTSLEQQGKLKTEIETIRKQVEALAEEAEKSKDEARKAEQAAKVSELFSKALKEKDVDKQIELYTEILKISPDDADAIHNLGATYSAKGEYDKAIEKNNQVIDLGFDELYLLYYNRSIAYIYKNDLDQAIKDLKQSIDLNTNYEESKLGLEIVQRLQIIKNLQEESKLEEANEKAMEAMEIAKKTKDDDDDWVKIVNLKIKEIENLQKRGEQS